MKNGGFIKSKIKKYLIFAIILLAFALIPSDASALWFNSSWMSVRPITINTTVNLTSHNFQLNVTPQYSCNPNFEDIRITSIDNTTTRPYYISSYVSGLWANLLFRGNATTSNGTQAYLWCGNPLAANISNSSSIAFFSRINNTQYSGATWVDIFNTTLIGENDNTTVVNISAYRWKNSAGNAIYTRVLINGINGSVWGGIGDNVWTYGNETRYINSSSVVVMQAYVATGAVFNVSNISVNSLTITPAPALSLGAEEFSYDNKPIITSPTTTTYYTANQTLNFTVTGINATYPCWKTVDSATTPIGNVANNTANASILTLNNSAHTVSVTCYGGSPSANITTTVMPTVIYSELRAKNAVGGAAINTFTANFSSSSSSTILYTTTGLIQTPLDALPQGAVNLTVTADGFGQNNTLAYAINSTSFFNTSVYMQPASVTINVFDEKSPATPIYSNITFANSTASKTWNNISALSQSYSNLTLGDTTITVASAGYEARYYYLTITPQTLVNMSAYLLATASGQTVRWHIVTNTESAIPNVLVTGQRYISGVYVTATQGKTDTSGTATLFQDPTATYQMVFTHPDYNTVSSIIQPSSTDYKVYLSASTIINYTALYDDITVEFSPLGYIPNNATNQTFSFKITSSKSTLEYFGINLSFNGTLLGASEVSTSPSGGTVYVYSPLNQTGAYTVNGYFKKNSYDFTILTKKYINAVIANSNTSIISVLTSMNSTNVNDNGGMGSKSQGLIAIFITAVVAGSVSSYSKTGGSILGLMMLAFFTFVLSWFPAGIFFITVLGVIAVLYVMRY